MDNTNKTVSASKQRRVKNELAFKMENERVKDLVQNLLKPEEQTFLPVFFICECSEESCHKEIKMTVEEFQLAHQYKDQFIILNGHEQLDIEKLTERNPNYSLVEKYALKR